MLDAKASSSLDGELYVMRAYDFWPMTALLMLGCGSSGVPDSPSADASALAVQVGVPAGSDGLSFAPLADGDELRLQSFGQGGTHVMLGVRCIGFGNKAFVSITLRNLQTGAEAVSPAPVRPQLLYCVEEQTCDLVPLLAMTAGLTAPDEERNGLPIEVVASVRNEAGQEATDAREVVLSTADL